MYAKDPSGYESYQAWAGRLYDVYSEESGKIYDAYISEFLQSKEEENPNFISEIPVPIYDLKKKEFIYQKFN